MMHRPPLSRNAEARIERPKATIDEDLVASVTTETSVKRHWLNADDEPNKAATHTPRTPSRLNRYTGSESRRASARLPPFSPGRSCSNHDLVPIPRAGGPPARSPLSNMHVPMVSH